jgi:hypothetical protein
MSWSFRSRSRPNPLRLALPIASAHALMTAQGANAQAVPRLEVDLSALASDNPFLLPGRNTGAVLGELTARPGLTFETPTGSRADLGAEITHRRYSRRYGDFTIGRITGDALYRDSEFLSVNAGAILSRDVAVDLLTSSVEAATDPTSVRTGYVAYGSLTWRPNEYNQFVPEVRVERYDYQRSAFLGDTRAISGSLAYSRRTGPNTRLGARGGVVFSNTALLSDTSTQFLYATLDRRLNEGWRATGEVGVERNDDRVEAALGLRVIQRARTLLSGRAQLCRDAPGPVICIATSLNSEVSGLGGLQRRAVVSGTLDTRLAQRTTVRLEAEYQRTVMQGTLFPEFDAIRGLGTLTRTLRPDLRLGATVQYLRRQLVAGERIGAAFAGLQLTYIPSLR